MARSTEVLTVMAMGVAAAAVFAFLGVAFNGFGATLLRDSIHLSLTMPEVLQASAIGGALFTVLGVPLFFHMEKKGNLSESLPAVIFLGYLGAIGAAMLGGLVRGLVYGPDIGYLAAAAAIGTLVLPIIIAAGCAIIFGIAKMTNILPGKDVDLPPLDAIPHHAPTLKTDPYLYNKDNNTLSLMAPPVKNAAVIAPDNRAAAT